MVLIQTVKADTSGSATSVWAKYRWWPVTAGRGEATILGKKRKEERETEEHNLCQ